MKNLSKIVFLVITIIFGYLSFTNFDVLLAFSIKMKSVYETWVYLASITFEFLFIFLALLGIVGVFRGINILELEELLFSTKETLKTFVLLGFFLSILMLISGFEENILFIIVPCLGFGFLAELTMGICNFLLEFNPKNIFNKK